MAHKILIADDEQVVHNLLRRLLPGDLYSIEAATTGQEALELARSAEPDLVLLDVHMPGLGGLEVLERLKGDPRTRMIPVILVTGDGAPAERVRGLDRGADDYVSKPFDFRELAARVATALRRSRRDLSANPLTKLPGSPAIEEEVSRRIGAREPFAFLYVDIDEFKAYNDVYGYARGDAVIRETAEILLEAARAEAADAFVGHIGGDDFVVVCDPARAERVARHAAGLFDSTAKAFYNAADLRRGYLESRDRRGAWRRSALASITIGGVSSERRRLEHYAQVVEIASEMKAYVKGRPAGGSSAWAFDSRRDV